ncbi:MAG TPA: PAS domain-containing protein, partial [Calditrichia bacterium]|nr:PAS domain-containing protein [Calditrichia bacterium]
MQAESLNLLAVFLGGTTVLLMLVSGIVLSLMFSRRRLYKTQQEKLEAIQKSEQKYVDLFENVSDIVYVHDLEMRITQINQAITRELGFEVDNFLGANLR